MNKLFATIFVYTITQIFYDSQIRFVSVSGKMQTLKNHFQLASSIANSLSTLLKILILKQVAISLFPNSEQFDVISDH